MGPFRQAARFMLTVGVSLLFLISGCHQGPYEVAAPPIDVENDLRPGMSPAEVEKILGKHDRTTNYLHGKVPVLKELEYRSWGLHLTFHETKGLGKIQINNRWTTAVHGFKHGDLLEDITEEERRTTMRVVQNPHWRAAYCLLGIWDKERDGKKVQEIKVTAIVLEDLEITGNWLLKLR